MFRFAQRFGRHSQARHARARRPRVVQRIARSGRGSHAHVGPERDQLEKWRRGAYRGFWPGRQQHRLREQGRRRLRLAGRLRPRQISAGLDAAGNPEVFAIGGNNAVYVNDNGKAGSTWAATSRRSARRRTARSSPSVAATSSTSTAGRASSHLGGDVEGDQRRPRRGRQTGGLRASAATTPCTSTTTGKAGSTWAATSRRSARRRTTRSSPSAAATSSTSTAGRASTRLGGDAKAISAGLDAAGKPEVYAIGANNAAYVNDNETDLSTWAATSRRSARRRTARSSPGART